MKRAGWAPGCLAPVPVSLQRRVSALDALLKQQVQHRKLRADARVVGVVHLRDRKFVAPVEAGQLQHVLGMQQLCAANAELFRCGAWKKASVAKLMLSAKSAQ
jgi:hypothetical protein